ncbi:MAG: hypothetical protein Q9181_002055 [Wetmoreana brouardii]
MSRMKEDLRRSKVAEGTQRNSPFARDNGASETFSGFESDGHEQVDDDKWEKESLELELENAVFGDELGFHERLREHSASGDRYIPPVPRANTSKNKLRSDDQDEIQDVDDADLFILDSGPFVKPQPPTSHRDRETSLDDIEAAWHDSDDERIVVSLQTNPRLRKLRNYEDEDLVNGKEYTKRLRRQFERLYPVPRWATQSRTRKGAHRSRHGSPSASDDSSPRSDSEDEMLVDSGALSAPPLAKLLQRPNALIQQRQNVPKGKRKLQPEVIDIQRTKDVGEAQPVRPETLNIIHLKTHANERNTTTSSFLPPNGSKILFAGRRRFFHSWDLGTGRVEKISRIYGHQSEQKSMERFKLSPCGRWIGLVGSQRKGGGLINVLDAHTNQWIAEVRVESMGGVADFAWWSDGEGMTVLGKGGEAVEWDGRQRQVLVRWVDEGAVGTTVVAMGGHGNGARDMGGDRWIAVGSSSGIVNIYDRKSWGPGNQPASPKPTRVFDQLTTPTSHLAFSPDGQLMMMASRWKRDALRLVHLPSCTVYKNWPTSSTPLGRITAVAFSPGSEMVAVANEQGKIRLWEIRA